MSDAVTFWQGIAKLPEPAQRSFWDAGVHLSRHIGEPTAPRRLEYDFSKPPPGMPWWEKLLFYAGQGQYNQAVSQSYQAEATLQGAKWLWGALQGDFNKNPTTGQVIVGGIISLIPLVDQACDVRDVIANCVTLSDPEARKDHENWIALGLTCIGFVPEFGSAIKTVAKVAIQKGTALVPLLKHMEWVERSFKALKVACPWGRGPRDWLRKFDWRKAAEDAATYARRAFDSARQKAEAAAKYAIGAVKAKLQELAQLFKEVVDKIASVLSDVAQRIKARVDEMLKKERQQAGNYDATPGGQTNRHTQGEVQPPKGPPPKKPKARMKCGEYGKYGDLKKKTGEGRFDRDHIPSKAALKQRAQALLPKGKKLTPTQAKAIDNWGESIAIPRQAHIDVSPTYGQSSAAAAVDASNLAGAARRDVEAMLRKIDEYDADGTCKKAYQKAAAKVMRMDNAAYDDALKKILKTVK